MCGSYGTTEVVTCPFAPFLKVLIPSRPGENVRQSNLGKLVFVRVANHAGYAGQGSDFFRSTLGVASGDDDPGVGILALHAANRGTGILVGGGCHGTGVEDDHVGIGGGGAIQPALLELALQGSAIRLGGAAAEIFYTEGGHVVHGSAFRRNLFQHGDTGGTEKPKLLVKSSELWLLQVVSGFSVSPCLRGELSLPAPPQTAEASMRQGTPLRTLETYAFSNPQGGGMGCQADAAVLRDWKHSRQNTGRPCVGRKGTVVSLPHWEQVARVSTLE